MSAQIRVDLSGAAKGHDGPVRAFISAEYDNPERPVLHAFVVSLDGVADQRFRNLDMAETYARQTAVDVFLSSSVHDYFSDLKRAS